MVSALFLYPFNVSFVINCKDVFAVMCAAISSFSFLKTEDIAAHITANTSLQLIEKEIMKGYDAKADTMFAALFQSQ